MKQCSKPRELVRQYPLSYNPIIEYYNKIVSGEEIASYKIRKIYKKLVDDIYDTTIAYEYSARKANHALEFIENYCKHSKGKWGGKPVILMLWQKAMIAATFGFIEKQTGFRKYREVLLVVARKNGKSTIAAAIGLYLMLADGESGAEIYAVATKKDQAKIIWQEAKKMVKKSPALRKRVRSLVGEMIADFNESTFKPLGSDSDTLDGLNVHGATMDEIHAWKDQNLYDVIADGCTSRDNPLIFITTTAGTVRESVYDGKYEEAEMLLNGIDDPDGYKDDHFLPLIYELNDSKTWQDPEHWKEANPALGEVKKIELLQTKINKAIANPRLVNNLLCKDFNIRGSAGETWLTFEEIYNPTKFSIEELKPRYGIGGTDLSKTTDLTAAKVIFMVPNDPHIYVMSMYWLPADLLEQRSKEDGKVPYEYWVEQGYLRAAEGNKVHPKVVTEWFIEIRDTYGLYLPWIGYDGWAAEYWVEEMSGYFGAETMEKVYQGAKTLSSPMEQVGADFKSGLIVYNNNPIDKWCFTNTCVETDRNGNITPIKSRNSRKRIDGTAALLDAYVALERHRGEYANMI